MATADKLSYLLDTKAKIKNAINNDISLVNDDTIFREYADKIDSLSDSLKKYIPTETKTGSSIQISDAVPLNAKSLIVYGNSYQKTTKGINVLDTNNIPETNGNGITFESDENGIITFNGNTTSGGVTLKTNLNYQISGDYTLIFRKISGEFIDNLVNVRHRFTIGNAQNFGAADLEGRIASNVFDKNSETIITNFSSSDTINKINMYLNSGCEFKNYKFCLYVVKGTFTESTIPDFEPFTGGIASPNPNYPQEIEVIEGIKNLFDGNVTKQLVSDTGTIASNNNWDLSEYIEVKPKIDYTFSHNSTSTNQSLIVIEYDENKQFVKRNAQGVKVLNTPYTIKTDAITKYVKLNYNNTFGNENFVFEEGRIAHPCIPYGTWLFVKNVGKNSVDENLITNIDLGQYENGIITSNAITNTSVQNVRANFSEPFKYKSDTTYYFSADIRIKEGAGNLNKINDGYVDSEKVIFPDLSNEFQRYITKKKYSSDTNYSVKKILFQIAKNSNNLVIEIKNIMISTDSGEIYEPYRQEEITLIDMNIYDDNGKIIGNHELVKIGATKDDLIVENGIAKIIKRIGKSKIESSMIMTQANILEKSKEIRVLKNSVTSNINQTGKILMMSNAFKYSADTWNNDEIGIFGNAGDPVLNQIAFRVSKDTNTETFFDENDVWIYYPLKEPYEIELSPVKIKMHEGTNNIELMSNLETEMKLEYYKDYKANSEVVGEVAE